MKLDRGFRIPEPSDIAIRWPNRGGDDPKIAIYMKNPLCWQVVGNVTVFTAENLVHQYGNDWERISIEWLPKVEPKR